MTLTFHSKRLLALASTLALALCPALSLRAQTAAAGTIAGTVTDSNGAIVSKAAVTITDTDTGVVHTTATTDAGAYNQPFLQPGNYEVVISATGMAKVDRKNLVLTVGQTLTVDAQLQVGSTATEVTVTSETPILDPQKTEVSQTIGQSLISNLPVNARNWSDFVLLTPNVVQDGGSGLVSFHGISGLYNQNYVDGANNNQMLFSEARGRASGAPFIYSGDSIKEFQAETSNYSVEFGQAAGGQVNAITRSGTNKIHGDLFYTLRYPTMNALDPFTKYSALHVQTIPSVRAFLLTQATHQQHDFGGSVGGPLIKDRLFYFFTYDGFRKVGKALYFDTNTISLTPSGQTSSTSTITPSQCPVVGTPGYNGTTGITAAQCNAAITFLQNNSTAAPTRFQKENVFFPRLDYHVNSKNDAFVDLNFVDYDSSYGYNGAATFQNSSPSTNGPTSYHERFVVGGLTTQLGKASVNQFRAQWGRDLETAGDNAAGPSVSMGVDTFGMPNALPRVAEPDEHRIQLTDVFSTTHGNHSLKVGGDANIVHEVMINLFQGGGIYTYTDTNNVVLFQDWAQDAFAGQPGDTDPYAGYHYDKFVQTIDVVNTAAGTQGKDDFWMKMWDGFAEDNWKLRPNFTVTAGVRYDLQLTPPPGKVNNNFAPISTKYSSSIKNVTDRVQPRVAFSWQPHTGTVVRGGYGLFSALNQGSTYYAMRVENGVVQVNYNYTACRSLVGSVSGSLCTTPPTTATKLQYPNVPFQPTGPALSTALYPSGGNPPTVNGPTILGPQSFHGLDPNFVPPLAHEMNLSVEQAMPGRFSLQVGYVGTRGMRLPVFIDANLVGQTPHGVRTVFVQDAGNNVTKTLTVPYYLPSDRINTSLSSYNTGFSVANTWYNSLAVTARRPFTNGLEVLMNYTWSRATDTGQVQGAFGTFYGGDTPLDPNNVRLENGLSDTDVRNRMTLSFVYQPHILADNKVVKHLLDDFVFSGTDTASAGQPVFLSMGNTVNGGAEGNIYGGAMSSSSGVATTGRAPQVGRNSIIGPGFNNLDMRVSRNIPIHESIYMQFSVDAFNVPNHQIITSVQGGYSTYLGTAGQTSGAYKCTTQAAPSGSTFGGCIVPSTNTGLNTFYTTSSTSGSNLYTARQLQFAAKLFF
ncbi:MAG TPA: TonB-dependent receptor [Acidobacteriaceae bacterium]|nr:TonB-dependent receptor [Acidobacteriaceae bacterium]